MPSSSFTDLRRLVVGLWVAVLLLGAGLIVFLLKGPSAQAAIRPPASTETQAMPAADTATASITPVPSQTASPTQTFTPSLSPTITETPVPFSEGPFTIGKSVEGRPLEVYRFGRGEVERMIVAGIHGGGEYNTVVLGEQLMAYIRRNPEIIPENVTLYFLHALNPDGVARSLSYLGRANARGVDLNRNWPDGWQKDWDRTHCWNTTYVTGGKKPASEPETEALMNFVKAHHFSGLINYHSAALGVFPGGVPPTDDSKQLAQAIADISTYSYPPIDIGCIYTGGMVDWTADLGIPSVDVELTDHTHTDFEMNLEILKMFLGWNPE
jgi:hypothetical protein